MSIISYKESKSKLQDTLLKDLRYSRVRGEPILCFISKETNKLTCASVEAEFKRNLSVVNFNTPGLVNVFM